MPALALGRALVDRGHTPGSITYVGSRRGLERRLVPEAGFEITLLPGRGISRRFELRNVAAIVGLVVAMGRALGILARRRPAVVVSVGGYAGFASGAAAVALRVPLVLVNADSLPGAANRMLGRFAKANAVAFAGTPLPRKVLTGTPVRPDFTRADLSAAGRRDARRRLGLPREGVVVAVYGGSLGARRLNQAVLGMVRSRGGHPPAVVHHVIGRRDWPELAAEADALSAHHPSYRAVEYEERMADLLVAADLVACRAGATSIAELTVVGRPAVLVPFPDAPGDHQTVNAMEMVRAGAAVCIPDAELNPQRLAGAVESLVGDPDRLDAMGRAARSLGRPDAAEAVATLVERWARPVPVAGARVGEENRTRPGAGLSIGRQQEDHDS
jgi:UDP-N-acetylglucosamine--N-acetylmuramyl-(pentapeptide) pyrophosphoryl-undecaprenol N-acetylglucosamine transferase